MRNFDNWIDAYVSFTANTEPATLFRKWVAVATIASALQRKVWIDWHTRIYPNMYIVVVGPPGDARKGTAMEPMWNFIRELGIKTTAQSTTWQQIIVELKKSESAGIQSVEGYIPGHSSLTVYSKEFSNFLGLGNNELISCLTDWWDCPSVWDRKTKNSGEFGLSNIWLNLIGATTTDLLRAMLPSSTVGSGLLSRVVFIYSPGVEKLVELPHLMLDPTTGRYVPAPRTEDITDDTFKKLLADLADIHTFDSAFKLTDEAIGFYVQWYRANHANRHNFTGPLVYYPARRQIHLLKLSMIISAAMSDKQIITNEHIVKADALLCETEIRMPKVFSGFGSSDKAATVAAMLDTIQRYRTIKFAELMSMYVMEVGTYDEMMKLVYTLQRMGAIEYNRGTDTLTALKGVVE